MTVPERNDAIMPKTPLTCAALVLVATSLAVALRAQGDRPGEGDCVDCAVAPVASTTLVQEFEKLQSETLSEIIRIVESVPEDRQAWKPSESSPSVLDLCDAIANDNRRLAIFLRQRVEPATASTGGEAIEQLATAFEAVSRGVAALPPGQDPADMVVDTKTAQVSGREFLMRHVARNARSLGELMATARLAAEERPAG